MSLISYTEKVISDFRGAWTVRDQTGQDPTRGSAAKNVRFKPNLFLTRPGLALVLTFSAAIQSMYNWIATDPFYGQLSRLVYLAGANSINLYDLGASINNALYTLACVGLSVVEADTRLYIAHYDSLGRSAGGARICNVLFSGAPTDVAFPDPPTAAFTVTDTGTGACSQGVHLFGYRFETRSGFPGRMSIASGVSCTVGAGGRTVTFSLPITVPTDAAFIHISMTTVDDTFQYFDVALQAVTPGATFTITQLLSISDSDLVALPTSADVTPNFDYLTVSNGAPVPSKIVRFGNRNAYIQQNTMFISDPYAAQTLRQPNNAIQVEGQRTMVTAEVLAGQLIIFCANSTYTLGGDNSTDPRDWAPPSRISESIGTLAINGVCPSAGFSFLWVAHDSGLYTFSGAYSPIPISFMFDSDWKRINWAAAQTIQMTDNASERCLYINVPLDGATSPNYRMVLDYSRARNFYGQVDPFSIDYSLDDYNSGAPVPSIALVQNYTSQIRELWVGLPSGKILRHVPGLRTDNATLPIHTLYETGLNLAARDKRTLLARFGGLQIDVEGSGQLAITPFGLGRQTVPDDAVDPLDLSATPDGISEARWHMISENQTIRFETGIANAGDWMQMQGLTIFHKPSGTTKAA